MKLKSFPGYRSSDSLVLLSVRIIRTGKNTEHLVGGGSQRLSEKRSWMNRGNVTKMGKLGRPVLRLYYRRDVTLKIKGK